MRYFLWESTISSIRLLYYVERYCCICFVRFSLFYIPWAQWAIELVCSVLAFFFRASSFLLLFLFSFILCVCLCASAEHIRSSASFALCDSSRFSFLLAIIFCTRPNGAFSYFVFSCSCFCLSLRIDTFHLFAIVFPFLCFLSFSLSYCIYGVTAVPIFHQKRKKNILCNRMAMAIPIIKNKANENENKRSTYRAERTRRSTLQQN